MKAILKLTFVLLVVVFFSPAFAQQQAKETQKAAAASVGDVKNDQKASQTADEILLDALHLDASIEKPSVSIVPKRIEPRLDGIEYVLRDFDRELRHIPAELFDFEDDKRRFKRIEDIDKILSRSRN